MRDEGTTYFALPGEFKGKRKRYDRNFEADPAARAAMQAYLKETQTEGRA